MTDDDETAAPTLAAPIAPRDQVIAWLLAGYGDAQIKQALAARWPKESPDALALAAVEHFEAAARCEPDVVIGFALEACRHLYQKSIEIGDYPGALKAVKELVAIATKHVHPQDDDGEEAEQQIEAPGASVGASPRREPQTAKPSKRQKHRDPAVRGSRKKKAT